MTAADRRRHLYLIGQTGTGKSTLLGQLIAQDIGAGQGCALIDPHGDLALEVLAAVPRHRIDDVILIDPSDTGAVVGLNPFFRVPRDERALVAANLVATMKHIWRDSWGPRLEYILFNTVRALLDVRSKALRPSLLAIPRVFVDAGYRGRVVREIEDAQARQFFAREFAAWNERQLAEYLSSTQNKIGQFLANPFIRNIFGMWRPTVDLGQAMADRRILIVRLPKGLLGEEPANLMGSLLVSGLLQAAMGRAELPEAARPEFHLYIDEFQNFTTEAFASVLAEARKYALTLTVAHQYVAQLSEPVREAVFGNVGNLVAFRLSGRDAERLSAEIGGYAPEVFRDLDRGAFCARLLEGGAAGAGFLGRTTPPQGRGEGHAATIRRQCRQRYARPRGEVERQVAGWLGRQE